MPSPNDDLCYVRTSIARRLKGRYQTQCSELPSMPGFPLPIKARTQRISFGNFASSSPTRRRRDGHLPGSTLTTCPARTPTAHPTNPPAVDAVAQRHGMGKSQELGLHGRGVPDRPEDVFAWRTKDGTNALVSRPGR